MAYNFKLELEWEQHPFYPETRSYVTEGVCTCKLERRERELWEVGGDRAEGRRPVRPQLWNNETEKGGDTKLIAKPEAVPRVKHLWIFMC